LLQVHRASSRVREGISGRFPAALLEVVPTGRIGTDIVSYLGERWRVTRQNMGIPAQSVGRVVARFTSDVVNLKPRLALLEGGSAADIGSSDGLGRTLETYLSTFRKLLDACQANSIKPVVLLILPGGPGTTATQSQKRGSWNSALRDLAKGYAGAVVVDASPYVGVYRPDGAPNNLDSIDTRYSAGDIGHFTPAGYQRIAQAIVDQYTEP
jgi:lysophospholipase L1-like esterase